MREWWGGEIGHAWHTGKGDGFISPTSLLPDIAFALGEAAQQEFDIFQSSVYLLANLI